MTDLYDLFMGELEHEDERRNTYITAPFGWPGGKDLSKEHVLRQLPYRDSYIEHCGGTGIVMLNRQPSKLNVFNDRDSGVAAFYKCIANPEMVKSLVQRIELMVHSRELFIEYRETWQNCTDPIERAARWYYVVKMSFAMKKKQFARATDGRYNNPLLAALDRQLDAFQTIHRVCRTWQVENLSLFQSIKDYDKEGAVHYIDPPYLGTSPGVYQHEMSVDEHRQLVGVIMRGKGYFALSGYPNPVYDNPSLNWDNRITWEVPVTMQAQAFTEGNNKVGHENYRQRETALECLWIKDNTKG